MNKKGFTTIELIVSFTLVSIMIVALMSIVLNYRNRIMREDTKSQIVDFKNQITKIIYDDIINGKYQKILSCEEKKCAKFVDGENNIYELRIDNNYLIYNDIKYQIPDAKKVIINDFQIANSEGLSHLKIPMKHADYSDDYSILININ